MNAERSHRESVAGDQRRLRTSTTDGSPTRRRSEAAGRDEGDRSSEGVRASTLLRLQRTAGNQAVQSLHRRGRFDAVRPGQPPVPTVTSSAETRGPSPPRARASDSATESAARESDEPSESRVEDEREDESPEPTTASGERAERPVSATQPAVNPVSTSDSLAVFPKLRVSRPTDQYEREADAVAAAVTANRPAPVVSTLPVSRRGDETVRRVVEAEDEEETEPVQARLTGERSAATPVTPKTAATIRRAGVGHPVPRSVRARIEPRLGTTLDGVRVHTDPAATTAARSLHARAFTHRNHIFLGRGESAYDLELMAHETTHVVQQDADAGVSVPHVQRLSLDDLPGIDAEDIARRVPGYTLATVLVGYNPVTDEDVDFNARNLFKGVVELMPFGADVYDALSERGIVDDAFEWLEENAPDLSLSRIWNILEEAWDEVSLLEPSEIFGILIDKFRPMYLELKAFVGSALDKVMELLKEAAIGVAEGFLSDGGLWSLVKKVLGYDPLRDEEVKATPTEILEDFLLYIGKEEHLQQMRERETVEETAEWVATQIETFKGLLKKLGGLFASAWEAIQPRNILNLTDNLRSLATKVFDFVSEVGAFAWTVASEVFSRIKDALLGWLSEHVDSELPGFDLLTVILGQNPFTGETVPRTAENLIRGFITLLPGGHEIYQQLAESGVVAEAGARIEGAIERLGITWKFIRGLFTEVWDLVTIEALAKPFDTVLAIVARFKKPVSRLFGFVNVVLREIFFLVLAAMQFPTELLEGIVANVMRAIDDVKRDPIGLLMNMAEAVKQGFVNFFDNVLVYLGEGLVDWLFRGLRDAGIESPDITSLESVLGFALDVLGISVDRLWELLGERIGEENVERIRGAIDRVTGIWNFVKDVQERGVAAIWEYIESQISGLWDTVLEMAQEWIMERVIERAATWLLSLVDPTGVMAVINTFKAFFNAVTSAIEYMRDILSVVNDYVTALVSIARGDIEPGAKKLEEGLANIIPIAIGFLAKQLGIDDIGEKILEIVSGVRGVVDKALGWLVDKAVKGVESVLGSIGLDRTKDDAAAGKPTAGDSEVGETVTFTGAGETHRLFIRIEGQKPTVVVASQESLVAAKIRDWQTRLKQAEGGKTDVKAPRTAETQTEARTLLAEAEKRLGLTKKEAEEAADELRGSKGGDGFESADKETETAEKSLAYVLGRLFDLFEEGLCEMPGVSAPDIGKIAVHGDQPPGRTAGPEIHHTQSEHIIPFATARNLRFAVGFSERSRKTLRKFDDGMTTLLIYKGAAKRKDPVDNRLSARFEAQMRDAEISETIGRAVTVYHGGNRDDAETIAKEAISNISRAFETLRQSAVERTSEAIRAEWLHAEEGCGPLTNGMRRGESEPVPSESRVEEAANQQYDTIYDLVSDALLLQDVQESEHPVWEGRAIEDANTWNELLRAGYDRPYQNQKGRWVIRRPPGSRLRRLTVDEDGIIHHTEE